MDLQRQQLVLQHEIRILEKQKEDISRDLNQIEASKKAEYTQYTQQIKDLQKRRNDLMEQVEKLKEAMGLITQTYTEAKQSLEKYREEQLKDVEVIVENAKEKARVMTISANKESIRLAEEKEELSIAQQQLKESSAALGILNKRYLEKKEKLDKSIETFAAAIDQRKDALYDLDIQVNKLTSQQDDLLAKNKELQERIASDLQQIETKWENVRKKEREIEHLDIASKQRTIMLDKRLEDVQNEERAIKDRRETLERAIEEMRGKGVKI